MPTLVIRTNFTTTKGQLMRMISFPPVHDRIFEYEENYFFICFIALTFFTSLVVFIRLWGSVEAFDLTIKFLDLVSSTAPPSLPISMTFGTIYAIEKMKKKKIYCVSSNKVFMGGLVDLICFDKTGTLTEDHMDFYCLVPANKNNFSTPITNNF